MDKKVYIVKAFVKNAQGGNPAGVIVDADGLNDRQMQQIATQLGASETAFVLPSKKATRKLRFFTPTEEVDLCGHATIATWSLLNQLNLIKPGDYTQETLAGVLKVRVQSDGRVFMQQTVPKFLGSAPPAEVAKALNIGQEAISLALPPRIVSTGLKDLFVCLRSRSLLDALQPNMEQLTKLSRSLGVTGLHVYALGDGKPVTAYARNFAPLVGIPEESATGTSNGALLCYLKEEKHLKPQAMYAIHQGDSMGQPSIIYAKFEGGRVWAGGDALSIDKT